jgi:glycosyltransferase involved in cell wall biosynthesis
MKNKTMFVIAPSLISVWYDLVDEMKNNGVLICSSYSPLIKEGMVDIQIASYFGKLIEDMDRPALFFPNHIEIKRTIKKNNITHLIYWGDCSHLGAFICKQALKQFPEVKFTIRAAQNIKNAIPFPFKLYMKNVAKRSNAIISVAPPSSNIVKKLISDHSKIKELGNGHDSKIFNNKKMQRKYDITFCARLEPRKGTKEAVDVIKRLAEDKIITKVAFAGWGTLEEYIKTKLQVYIENGTVDFLGKLSPPEVAILFNKSKYSLLLSKENISDNVGKFGNFVTVPWTEQFGRAVIEAQACGAIPIVTNTGGLPFAIGEAGFIFEKYPTSTELYEKISYFVSNYGIIHEEMGGKLKENATRFHVTNITKNILN